MKTTKKIALGALAAVSSLALLAGCASGGTSGGSTGGDEGGNASGGSGDNTFVVAVGTNPAHLNAAITTDNSTGFIGDALFERLVYLTNSFELKPGLAESWESNDDATEFTFHLREGVTWHDGEPFTSADVKFNVEEVLPLHSLGGNITNILVDVETPDENTAIIKLSEPFGPVVEAMTAFKIIPEHLYAGSDIVENDANMAPVGTGPYKLDAFNTGDSVELSQYEGYWGEQGDADRVIFTVIPDDSARAMALQSGDVDFIPQTFFDLAQRSVFEGNDKFLLFEASANPQQMLMFFNTENEALKNFEVREAIYRAIDREAISTKVYLDTATPAKAPIPNQVEWAIDPSIDFTKQFAYDPAAAEKMLDDAGFPKGSDGKRFTLNLNYITGLPTFAGTAEQVKANLEAIGVGVNLVAEDVNVYIETTFTNSTFDLSVIELAGYADPNLGVSRAYKCNADRIPFVNANLMCDDEIDAGWNASGKISDRAERLPYFTAVQERIAETLGTVPLASAISIGAGHAEKWSGLEEYSSLDGNVWSALKKN